MGQRPLPFRARVRGGARAIDGVRRNGVRHAESEVHEIRAADDDARAAVLRLERLYEGTADREPAAGRGRNETAGDDRVRGHAAVRVEADRDRLGPLSYGWRGLRAFLRVVRSVYFLARPD